MAFAHKQYDRHFREYTVVGISAAFAPFFSRSFHRLYGRTFEEIIVVVKNGQFYHFQVRGDRERLSRSFLRRINAGRVDLAALTKILGDHLPGYRQLVTLPSRCYTLYSLRQFYRYYRMFLPVAYAGMDTIDALSELVASKRSAYRRWAVDVRKRAEAIYKVGESVFIPRYLRWLKRHYLPTYSPVLLRYVFYIEMDRFLHGRGKLPSLTMLVDRRRLCLLRFSPFSRYRLLTGRQAVRMIAVKRLFDPQGAQDPNVEELRGQVAFPGRVTGKVRIVRLRSQMAQFRAGEILVTTMTDPAYLPIMKMASAFVTNEGGMLSHAAIVARELRKPFVIGTRIAAHVLHNGDVIEVDATKGVVRIVKRA